MIDKKICGDCSWFRRGSQVGEGFCVYGDEISSVKDFFQPACSFFNQNKTGATVMLSTQQALRLKRKPGEHAPKPKVAITEENLLSMALDMARKVLYDKADWMVMGFPVSEFPKVEKALRKWFKELGVEVVEK